MKSAKKTWLDVWHMFRHSWKQAFLIHVVFTALGFLLFSPLLAVIGGLLIRMSGQSALDDQDIVYFFLTPLGMFALILMLAIMVTVLVFEQVALMRLAVAVRHGQTVSLVEALLFTASKVSRLFVFIVRLLIRVLLLTLPFMATAFVIAMFLISDYDINYYLARTPGEFWWAAILISLVLIVMTVLLLRKLLCWSMALPMVLFNDELPRRSFSISTAASNRNLSEIFSALLIWGVLAMLPGVILVAGINLLGSWTVPMVEHSISMLVILLGGLSVAWMIGNFFITAFTSAVFAYLLIGFYESYGPGPILRFLQAGKSATAPGKTHLGPKKIFVVLLAGVIATVSAGVWLVESIHLKDDVLIIAHRGASGKAPENTLAAFQQAIEDRSDWIELDVQETADGEVVVFHDSDFMKLAGDMARVNDISLAEVQEIDIGSWFDPAFSKERPPSLQQVLETVKGRVNVVIELKYYGYDQMLEQRVVDIVEATGMVDSTAIMSLKYDALKKIRVLRPDWQIGLLSAQALGDLTSLDTDFLAVRMRMARSRFIRRVHQADKKVFVWTVNDPVTMSRLMSLGVDGIITDEPEMARQVLEQRTELNIAERLLVHTVLFFGQPYIPRQYRDDSP